MYANSQSNQFDTIAMRASYTSVSGRVEGLFPGPPYPNHLASLPPQYLMENLRHDEKKPFFLSPPPPQKKKILVMNDFKIVTESQYVINELLILK